MKMFQDYEGVVFAYDEQQVAMGLADDKTEMTAEEVEAHVNPAPPVEQLLQQQQYEARAYLNSTDWYVIRRTETGVEVPAEVLDKRAEARGFL
jgi:hypothetical protein